MCFQYVGVRLKPHELPKARQSYYRVLAYPRRSPVGSMNWGQTQLAGEVRVQTLRGKVSCLFVFQPANLYVNGEKPSILPTGSPFRTKLTGFLWLGDALFWVANQ